MVAYNNVNPWSSYISVGFRSGSNKKHIVLITLLLQIIIAKLEHVSVILV